MKKIILFLMFMFLALNTIQSQETIKQAFAITDTVWFSAMNGSDYSLRIPESGLINVYLKKTDLSVSVQGTEVGTTGYYVFDFTAVGSYAGFYELWVNGVKINEFGVRQVAKYIDATGSIDMEANLDLGSNKIVNVASPTAANDAVNLTYLQSNYYPKTYDTNYVKTTGSNAVYATTSFYGVTDFGAATTFYNVAPSSDVAATLPAHLVRKYDLDADTNLVRTTGNDYIYGNHTFTGNPAFSGVVAFSGDVSFSDQVAFETHAPTSTVAATLPQHLMRKYEVEELVATIIATPYQESSNRVRLIPNGTTETGKVYTSFNSAVNYFASESATNPCYIEIFPYGTNVTIEQGYLTNYVHLYSSFYSAEKKTSPMIILGCGTASITKTDVRFEGLTIMMGANDITTDRTYNGFTFKDCTIFAFKNTTFTNCVLSNVTMYHATGYSATYDGTTEIYNCKFNQYTTEGGSFTGFISTMTDGFKTNYSMPTDISVACSW